MSYKYLISKNMKRQRPFGRKLCLQLAIIGSEFITQEGIRDWHNLLKFLYNSANSSLSPWRRAALRILTCMTTDFGHEETQHIHLIRELLGSSIATKNKLKVRFHGLFTAGSVILHHRREKKSVIYQNLRDLLPLMITTIADAVALYNDKTSLKLLLKIAEEQRKFLRPQLEAIFYICLKIYRTKEGEESWYHVTLKIMVTLIERAPKSVHRRLKESIEVLVPLLLQKMAAFDIDEDWATSEVLMTRNGDDMNIAAELALVNLANEMGGGLILPHVMKSLPGMLSHSDWKQRYAVMQAISALSTSCEDDIVEVLKEITNNVVNHLRDPDSHVRYAACTAVGQLSKDLAPALQNDFHEQVVPGLLSVLDDGEHPRVQAHAAAAFVFFLKHFSASSLECYVEGIMEKLASIFEVKFGEWIETGKKSVLQEILTTIAAVADIWDRDFVTYYDQLVPRLMSIIQNANTHDLRILRSKAIECTTVIALAVGRDKFIADAGELMDMLGDVHIESDGDTHTQTFYLIAAWKRVCKVIGKEFQQYLPHIMDLVMRTAAKASESELLNEEQVREFEDDPQWFVMNLGGQQSIVVSITALEEKAAAMNMIITCARKIKEGFADYADEAVRLMMSMFKFYFYEEIRVIAAKSLPYLLESAKAKGPQCLEELWLLIGLKLVKKILSETDFDLQAELLNSMTKCIEVLQLISLNDDTINAILEMISELMQRHFRDSNERLATKQGEFDDEEEMNYYYLDQLPKISGILRALLMANKEHFLPYFEQIAAHVITTLDPARHYSDAAFGMCVFNNCIEFCGTACATYSELFVPVLLRHIGHESPSIRQTAAHGCGVLAQFGGESFASTCAEFIPPLIDVIADANSRDLKYVFATESAICAVSKILKYNKSELENVDELIAMWYSFLPVVEEPLDAPHVYGFMCDLIDSEHPVVVSDPQRIVNIIADAFLNGVIAPWGVGKRMLEFVKKIRSDNELPEGCAINVTPARNAALQDAYRRLAEHNQSVAPPETVF